MMRAVPRCRWLLLAVWLTACPNTGALPGPMDAPPEAPPMMMMTDPVMPDAGLKPGYSLVYKVTDGDTVRVNIDGRDERLRYIGLDAPEVAHEDSLAEPFGQEAFLENRRLVEGVGVRVVYDEERRDRYDRLLGYVYLEDGTFVNAHIIEQGLAESLVIPPNTRYRELFENLEDEARAAHRGIWSQ